MVGARLELGREQVLAHRRRVGLLDERAPLDDDGLRRAAWAGLTDSVPRAAVLSLHARLAGVGADILEHPSLSQVWGPRFSAYVVAEVDAAPFTLGRYPDEPARRQRADEMARLLRENLGDRRMPYGAAGRAVGVHGNMFRYGATTGTLRIHWDGARQPTVWMVPVPAMDPAEARRELARRYFHVLGPGTAASFARWAGIRPARARSIVDAVSGELLPVHTVAGDASILIADEASFRQGDGRGAGRTGVRLLPSGDAFWLLWGPDRELVVGNPSQRAELWTSRVWPGALLIDGDVAGTWRRADALLSIHPWRLLSAAEQAAVEAEAASLPLGVSGPIRVRWDA